MKAALLIVVIAASAYFCFCGASLVKSGNTRTQAAIAAQTEQE
jgi:hypothetical protein